MASRFFQLKPRTDTPFINRNKYRTCQPDRVSTVSPGAPRITLNLTKVVVDPARELARPRRPLQGFGLENDMKMLRRTPHVADDRRRRSAPAAARAPAQAPAPAPRLRQPQRWLQLCHETKHCNKKLVRDYL